MRECERELERENSTWNVTFLRKRALDCEKKEVCKSATRSFTSSTVSFACECHSETWCVCVREEECDESPTPTVSFALE